MATFQLTKISVPFAANYQLLIGDPDDLNCEAKDQAPITEAYFIRPHVESLTLLELRNIADEAEQVAENGNWYLIAACKPEPFGLLRHYILSRLQRCAIIEQNILCGGSYA